MRKFVNAVIDIAAASAVSTLALITGASYGSTIDLVNGGFNDPVGDGMLTGVITVAVALVVAVVVGNAVVAGKPYVARIRKRRVAARNRRDAARRREEARRDRRYWKSVYQNRTH